MKNSYTDFHIDFGGTSVWYHCYSGSLHGSNNLITNNYFDSLGEKHFFLIRPTPGNLSLYERWMRLSSQSETFLGNIFDVMLM